jgi:hypothetical protein
MQSDKNDLAPWVKSDQPEPPMPRGAFVDVNVSACG